MMQINVFGFMCEYDFDRCTGLFSNPVVIYPEQVSNFNRLFWSGTYSPDGSKFYATTQYYFNVDTSYIIQYDLTAANIPASADTLYNFVWPVQAGTIRLAPDDKLYMTCFYDWGFPGFPYPDSVRNMYNENLSVVNYPDSLGAACDFQPFSFYLGGKRTYWGLPNNPDYNLGAVMGSPCDTLSVGISETETTSKASLHVFYNAAAEKLFINAQNFKGKYCTLQIFDVMGRKVFSSRKKIQPHYFTHDINCAALAKGMYIINLQTEKENLSKKFIKE